jgi:hypothetical protein
LLSDSQDGAEIHRPGKAARLQSSARSCCRRYGLGQDEDQGQLGAWYVLASIGLSDVESMARPDAPVAVIPPAFSRMTLFIPRTPFSSMKVGGFSKVELRQEPGSGKSKAASFAALHTFWEK